MKLTEFKNDVEITLKNCNAVFEKRLIHGKALLYITRPRFEKVSDLNIILSDIWELVEPTHTTREAFKMMADGKEMISYQNECYKFNHLGDLILTRQKFEDYEHAILSKNELRGKWTEYKEEN